ncbi:MAG: hypothetical protein IKB20_04845 [Clostridia bacterium]|nr:hypothetical protein [Clostridia bacterium]
MEILMLVLLYYLSQNPDFSESVKPLMAKLKNSEQMLGFLKDLSSFTQTFSSLKTEPPKKEEEKKENPQSPTEGIADEFIQNILESYLKKY